jgi:hypothetical protein
MGMQSLYWYPDNYGTVPWPRDWYDRVNTGNPAYTQNMLLHAVRMAIGRTGVVTSIRAAPGSPIRVLQNTTNQNGTVGDLMLDLDLALTPDPANLTGYQVFKAVQGNKLRTGPVVEKILGGAGITVQSSVGQPGGQGTVTVSLTDSVLSTGEFEEVALTNAKQAMIGLFPYIRLLPWTTGSSSNIPTGFIAKFRVPQTLPDVPYRVLVYLTVFGEVDIPTLTDGPTKNAGLSFTYSVLPDVYSIDPTVAPSWSSLIDGILTPALPTAVEIPFGKVGNAPIYRAYDPMYIHNNPDEGADIPLRRAQVLGSPLPNPDDFPDWAGTEPVSVRPGAVVAVKVTRSGVVDTANEYTGNIGFIGLTWRLVAI